MDVGSGLMLNRNQTYLNFAAQGHEFLASSGNALVDRIHYGHGILLAPSLLLENRLNLDLVVAHNLVGARAEYDEPCGGGSLVDGPNEWTSWRWWGRGRLGSR